jgi:hypothetical protein
MRDGMRDASRRFFVDVAVIALWWQSSISLWWLLALWVIASAIGITSSLVDRAQKKREDDLKNLIAEAHERLRTTVMERREGKWPNEIN